MSANPPPAGGRFGVRRLPAADLAAVVGESLAIYGRSPGRLLALFVFLFIPVEMLGAVPYVGMPLREVVSSVVFAGYFLALQSAAQGRAPALAPVLAVLKLRSDKLVLLAVTGGLPVVAGLLLWLLDWGGGPTLAYLGGADGAPHPPGRQQLELILASSLLSAPFWFVQPACVLRSWTASQTLAANLLACAANWRWVLGLSLLLALIGLGLDSLAESGGADALLALAGAMATELFLLGLTLTMMQRVFPPA